MKQARETMELNDDRYRDAYLLMILLPPPISLDLLCAITGQSPVEVLQSAENLVQSGVIQKYREMGAGYYRLADADYAKKVLATFPAFVVEKTARQAIAYVSKSMDSETKRYMHIAHIYETSGLPVAHPRELVQAGHYCRDLNITTLAESYYSMALKAMEGKELSEGEQSVFVDAAIGVCTCRDSSLPHATQRRFLQEALKLEAAHLDANRAIMLHVLVAKSFVRTLSSDEAGKHLERARQMLAESEVSSEVRLQITLAHSEWLSWQGFIDSAIESYESVLGNHEELVPDVETLKSFARLGWAYGIAGETARGLGLIRAVRKKATEMGAKDLERYAALFMVLVLGDAGRIEEGEAFLREVFNVPEELLDHYVLWPGSGKRAYFAYCRGDYEKAYEYLDQAWQNAKALGTPHHRGPDNLEVMLGLERRGMIHPEWTFESDLERLLNWPDIYMQGVALRFRARKELEEHGSVERAKEDLKKSISILTRAGARIELGQAQVLMARVLMGENEMAHAEKLLNCAWEVFSRVNPGLFPGDLRPYLDRTSKHAMWVESLLSVGEALGEIRTRDELLSQIIKQAIRISGAERGAVFLKRNSDIVMAASRNMEQLEISSDVFAAQADLVKSVFETGSVIMGNSELRAPAQSCATGMGGTACFPVKLKNKVMGVIFIDRGPTRLQLPEDEISLLRIISNQAAVAVENMEAYEEISDLKSSLEAETQFYRESLEPSPFGAQMVGRSEPFKKMLNLISRVAGSETTVMVTGETGAGKELVAQAIHRHSNRAEGPFIAVNVASLSPELIASELFGHEKGAFTGAVQTRKGRFELASSGTLFLDDIDALSLDIQAKLLRVLETRQFERVGGTRTLETRFRLVAASNRNLEELVAKGLFRSDFYYRLNVFPIRVPPLRERADDIPALAQYFMEMFCRKFGTPLGRLSKSDLDALMSYHWPGNIRELRHVLERAVLLSRGGRLTIPPLNASPLGGGAEEEPVAPLREMEARHIIKVLTRCRGKVSGAGGAAELLEVKPTTLYSMMKRLGVTRDAFRVENRKK